MQTIKTAFVVILLSAMLYGIYVVVNTPPTRPPRDVAEQLADEDATQLVVEDGSEDSSDTADSAPAKSPRRFAEPKSTSGDRSARELPPSTPRDQDSPATNGLNADGFGAGGSPTTSSGNVPPTRDSSPLGPNAARNESPIGAEALYTRAPVGLEAGETVRPPLPPRGNGDALPTVPVPDLKLPASPQAADSLSPNTPSSNTSANSTVRRDDSLSTSGDLGGKAGAASASFEKPSPNPAATERTRPEASNVSFNVDSPSPGVAGANGSPTSPTSPSTEVDPANSSPASPTVPTLPVKPSTADSKTMAVNPSSLAAGQEGVRFDPKEAVFERGWKEAQLELAGGRPLQAHTVLSHLYTDPRLTAVERRQLQDALDPLAARVIYSTEHLLDQPYFVRRGDSLQAIAEQYRLPWQLLANINSVRDPEFLVPGSKLKVFRGPMRADVDLTTQEITIYWKQLYAGRFPVSIGQDPAPAPGEYEVQEKLTNRDYVGPNGQMIPGGSAQNPYGTVYLGLGRNLAIHGAPLADGAPTAGCVSLSPRDAEDVFAILSVGSTVTIRR
ncbi:MAG: LysM peptidoglycan-binding domain-containing protein [Pirellulales bacterium]